MKKPKLHTFIKKVIIALMIARISNYLRKILRYETIHFSIKKMAFLKYIMSYYNINTVA